MVGVDEVGAHCGLFFPQDSVQQTDSGIDTNVPSSAETMVVDAVIAASATPESGSENISPHQNNAGGDADNSYDFTPTNSTIALNTNTNISATHPSAAHDSPQDSNAQTQTQGELEEAWSARYANLIQDVSTRIESWVLDAMSERLVRSFEG